MRAVLLCLLGLWPALSFATLSADMVVVKKSSYSLILMKDGKEAILRDNVRVLREASPGNPEMTLETSVLNVYPDDEIARTDKPVKLTQEFRNFDFLSPWEGADYPTVLPGDEKAGAQ